MRGVAIKEKRRRAVSLRRRGLSIGKIENLLRINRSTLSGWFKDVKLTQKQKHKLRRNWEDGLIKARKKAVIWHNAEKEKRLQEAGNAATQTLARIDQSNKDILELALAVLYLGEGSKKNLETGMGNSDPLILQFFLEGLRTLYGLDTGKIRCELYLRSDQNPERLKSYWAKALGLSRSQFKHVNIDKRTKGSKTYPQYKGVCNLRCGNVAIQRKLLYLSKIFFEQTLKRYSGA